MANDLKLALIINAGVQNLSELDKLTEALSKSGVNVEHVQEQSQKLSKEMAELAQQSQLIANFQELSTELEKVSLELENAQQRVDELAKSMKTDSTARIKKDFAEAKAEASRLKKAHADLAAQTQKTRKALSNTGISSKNLASEQKRLVTETQQATAALDKMQAEAKQLQDIAKAKISLGIDKVDVVEKQIREATDAYETLKKSGTLGSKELAQANVFHKKKLVELEGQLKKNNVTLEETAAGLGAVVAAGAGLATVVIDAVEFESAMAGVRKTVEASDEQFASLKNRIKELAVETGQTTGAVADIAALGGQLGVAYEDLESFIQLASKVGVAFNLSAEEAGNAVAKISNVFQIPINDIESLMDAINVLGNNTAAKEAEIVSAMQRIGGNARQFGLAATEAAALVDAMIALGKPPEVAATAINALLNKLQTAEAQGAKFQGALSNIGLSANQLAKDINAKPQQALSGFLNKIAELDKQSRATTLTELFGAEYADDIALLTGSLGEYNKALALVQDSTKTAGALNQEFDAQMQTTEKQLQQAKTAIGNMAESLGAQLLPVLSEVVKGATSVADGIASFADSYPFVTKLVAVFATLKVASFAINNGLKAVGSSTDIVKAQMISAATSSKAFATGMMTAATSTGRFSVGAASATVASKALNSALSLIKANPVGIALTAVVGVMSLLSSETKGYEESIKLADDALTDLQKKANAGINIETNDINSALTSVNSALSDTREKLLSMEQGNVGWFESIEDVRREYENLTNVQADLQRQLDERAAAAAEERAANALAQETKAIRDNAAGITSQTRQTLDNIANIAETSTTVALDSIENVKSAIGTINSSAALNEVRESVNGMLSQNKILFTEHAKLIAEIDKQAQSLGSELDNVADNAQKTFARTASETKVLADAFSALGEDVRKTFDIPSDADQKVLEALNNIATSGKATGEEVSRAFSLAFEQVETQAGLNKIQSFYQQAKDDGSAAAEFLKGKTVEMIDATVAASDRIAYGAKSAEEAFKTLGVNIDDMIAGMSKAERDVIDSLIPAIDGIGQKFTEQFGKTEEAARLSGQAIEQTLVTALSKIQSPAGLEEFKSELDASNLSAQQHAKILELVGEKANALNATFQDLGKSIANATSQEQLNEQMSAVNKALADGKINTEQYSEKVGELVKKRGELFNKEAEGTEATRKSTAATKEASEATKKSAEDTEKAAKATDKAKKSMDAHARAGKDVAEQMEGAGNMMQQLMQIAENYKTRFKESAHVLNEFEIAANNAFDINSVRTMDVVIRDLNLAIKQGEANFELYKKEVESAEAVQARLAEQTKNGEINMRDLNHATGIAERGVGYLNDATLDKLNSAIKAAEDRMNSLRKSSEDALKAMNERLLRAQGNTDEIEKNRYEEELKKLQSALEEARKSNDLDSISNYSSAIEKLRQAYFEEQKQRDERKAREESKPSSDGGSKSTNSNSNSVPSSTTPIVIDLGTNQAQIDVPSRMAKQFGMELGKFVGGLRQTIERDVTTRTASAFTEQLVEMQRIKENTN